MASAAPLTAPHPPPRKSSLPSAFSRLLTDPEHRRARELLLSQADKESLLALRLTSKQCVKPTAPHVFKDVEVTFKPTTFTKPARLAALAQIGHFVRRLTFKMPHNDETFLPPLLEPTTGSEVEYVYTPSCNALKSTSSRLKVNTNSDGAKELGDLLVKQYPPLYHAAVNVPSFVRALQCLINLKYLVISCASEKGPEGPTGQSASLFGAVPVARKSIVDHALVSLRMAIERASLPKLSHLTLSPMNAHAIQYLNPLLGLGARPNSVRRWRQIKNLTIHMPVTNAPAQLKLLHGYIGIFAPSLKSFTFHWLPALTRPTSADSSRKPARGSFARFPPARPSSTGTSYFPRTPTPHPSNSTDGSSQSPTPEVQRGPNPLTLHMLSHLQSPPRNTKRDVRPKEKSSLSSLPSLQSMTSASTLASIDSYCAANNTPSGNVHSLSRNTSNSNSITPPPSRSRPRLYCQPDYPSSFPAPSRISPPSSTESSPIRTQPSSSTSTSTRTLPRPSLRPLHLPHLSFFEVDGIACSSAEIATFIATHGTHLAEFKFEATTLTTGTWDDALAPLTALAGGNDAWKREARREEEVPLCLGPELSPVRERDAKRNAGRCDEDLLIVPCSGALVGGGGTGRNAGLKAGGYGSKVRKAFSPWMGFGGKSPLLGMAMGMGKPNVTASPPAPVIVPIGIGSCAAEAAAEMAARKGNGHGVKGGGQKALEDGVRKLLAETVFPWF